MALEGIRVLDFTWYAAGPAVTRELALNGAEVVKIESEEAPDGARVMAAQVGKGVGRRGVLPRSYFYSLNASKLSCAIDARHPGGRELLLRLAAVSDIVIDNFGGNWLERIGLSHEVLRQQRPDIIVMRMPMTSSRGPKSHFEHLGRGIQAMSGLMSVTGYADRPPDAYNLSYPDASANPYHALAALLAAVHYRKRTGKGQLIEVSQYRATVSMLGPLLLTYTANEEVLGPMGNRSLIAVPHGVYPTSDDGWCAISVQTEDEWLSFCKALRCVEWAQDSRFLTAADRFRNQDDLDAAVRGQARKYCRYELMSLLQSSGVAAGVVQDPRDLLENDVQARHRQRWMVQDGYLMDMPAYRMSVSRLDVRPGPEFLEDTQDVLSRWLDLSEAEINQLVAEGVIH